MSRTCHRWRRRQVRRARLGRGTRHAVGLNVRSPIAAPLSPAEGRRFGLLVGGAFLGLAGLAAWRGHSTQPWILGGLGSALTVGALLAPSRLGPIHRGWMALAAAISSVTTPLLMGVIYFVVVTPTGWLRRLTGGNRLRRPRTSKTFWVERRAETGRPADMEHQF